MAIFEANVSPPLKIENEKVAVAGLDRMSVDGDRLAERAAQAEHGAADDAGAPERQHRQPDHLPAGGAERQRGLLLCARGPVEDVREMAVTIGRIMIASTMPPSKMVPVATFRSLKNGMPPRW